MCRICGKDSEDEQASTKESSPAFPEIQIKIKVKKETTTAVEDKIAIEELDNEFQDMLDNLEDQVNDDSDDMEAETTTAESIEDASNADPNLAEKSPTPVKSSLEESFQLQLESSDESVQAENEANFDKAYFEEVKEPAAESQAAKDETDETPVDEISESHGATKAPLEDTINSKPISEVSEFQGSEKKPLEDQNNEINEQRKIFPNFSQI